LPLLPLTKPLSANHGVSASNITRANPSDLRALKALQEDSAIALEESNAPLIAVKIDDLFILP
jgi:hypothetical protein